MPERLQRIRQKIARGEALDPAEQLEWMDYTEAGGKLSPQERPEGEEPRESRTAIDDEEDVEHHDVGLRRNALNILVVERGDMFGTAIPFSKDMEQTIREIIRAVQEIYAARRQRK